MIEDADGEVYEKYAEELVRFASGLVGPADASDVLSSAVVRTFTSPAWPAVDNQRAYLYRAVLNESRMWQRAAARRRTREVRLAPVDDRGSITDPSVRPEVRAALARLGVRQRAVLFLSYWADLEPADIGLLLGVSSRTVRRDADRAHREMRRILHDHDD
jgi:RNA polymerase sigma factor (sigma-70 family)